MIIWPILALAASVFANTEIVNFEPTLTADVQVAADGWPVLTPANNEIQLAIPALRREEFANEAIIKLDLDTGEWDRFTKFTLRLHTLLSIPLTYTIHPFPSALPLSLQSTPSSTQTRTKYARVSVIYAGKPPPTSSMVPVVGAILVVAACAAMAVPRVARFLEEIVRVGKEKEGKKE
ncbi:hypothetical protein BDQ17DRAFT_1345993 [Cyathus striatus]|nr:hypothetical protein BDQ17DRAFT_1345993 [Cyathus striatus]